MTAFTGILCGDFSDTHQYTEEIMHRPVWTHEMADPETVENIKEAARPDFLNICKNLTGDTIGNQKIGCGQNALTVMLPLKRILPGLLWNGSMHVVPLLTGKLRYA
jgi:hypothetical protein